MNEPPNHAGSHSIADGSGRFPAPLVNYDAILRVHQFFFSFFVFGRETAALVMGVVSITPRDGLIMLYAGPPNCGATYEGPH